ncbi:hypothetical protein MBLNU457_3566t1 [Dothideomycetes sp. NU457]
MQRRPSHSNRRLSNASRYSNGLDDFASPQAHNNGSGMGNLADELDFADEDWDGEGGDFDGEPLSDMEETVHEHSADGDSTPFRDHLLDPPQTDGARDSGIDIPYQFPPSPTSRKKEVQATRKASGFHAQAGPRRPSSRYQQEEEEDKFSLEMEDAMNEVARLADPSSSARADTTARTMSALQDLGAQNTIDAQTHRLKTSMDSVSTQLMEQSKALQSLSSSIFSPFALSFSLETLDVDEVLAAFEYLTEELPVPDIRPLQSLTKLQKETADLVQTLSVLTDSLQMGKQVGTSAARHLRATQTMTAELRREREEADQAHFWIEKDGWNQKLQDRWCATECKDVVSGFDQMCAGLRKGLEEAASA